MLNTATTILTEASRMVAHIDDQRDRLAQYVGILQNEVRKLVDKYEGVRDPRYSYFHFDLDNAPVLVEYEYDSGQQGRGYGPPELCYEDIDASVRIDVILVNGEWISPEGVIAESVLERWMFKILEHEASVTQEQYEDRQSEKDYS